jgi:hypothetical protein
MPEGFKVPRFFSNRRVLLNSVPFIIAAATFILVSIAVKNPLVVEGLYSEIFYPFVSRIFSRVSGLFAFSLWDLFWVIYSLLLISGLIAVFLRRLKFGKFLLRTLQSVAVLYAVFYFLWGFNYFRPDIRTRLSWESKKPDEAIFRKVLDTLIIRTNACRTSVSDSDYLSIRAMVDDSFSKNKEGLNILFDDTNMKPKTMLFSSIAAKLGLSGYFGPFTNEVNLNSKLLPLDYPFSLAHEEAHKYGIASEAEANLVSFVICTTSDDKRLKYSGYMMILLYFLDDAYKLSDYTSIIKKIDRNVISDLRFRKKYYDRLQNKTLEKVSSAANDAYLKANHIKTGIKNYDQVVALTIEWYLHTGLIGSKYMK